MIRRPITALLFAFIACSDGTGPTSGLNGIISFTFTGAGGGVLYVAARAPNTGEEPDMTSSLTAGLSNDTVTLVAAYKALGNGRGDAVVMGLNRATVGSTTISVECDTETTSLCSVLLFVLDFDTETEAMDFNCGLHAGTIAITQISTTRIVGTFSGTGECMDASEALSPFSVTGGTFNVSRLAVEMTARPPAASVRR